MHHANAAGTDTVAAKHGQGSQPLANARMPCGCCAQPGVYLIGAANRLRVHALRVGASAADAALGRHKLGLHIAKRGVMGQDAFIDLPKTAIIHIKPVEIAIEDQARQGRFLPGKPQNGLQSRLIPVQSTDEKDISAVHNVRKRLPYCSPFRATCAACACPTIGLAPIGRRLPCGHGRHAMPMSRSDGCSTTHAVRVQTPLSRSRSLPVNYWCSSNS